MSEQSEAGAHRRRLCRCHDEPMDTWTSGGRRKTACAVKRRARQLADYHANAAAENYARTQRALKARIGLKHLRIEELERQLQG